MGFFFKTLIVVSLLFPLVAVLSFLISRKQKRAGRELLAVRTAPAQDSIVITKPFTVTRSKKWCRLRAVFAFSPGGRVMPAAVHPYTIRLSDENGRELFSEQRCMADFLGFCWHPDARRKRCGAAQPVCDTVLLEFLPPWPGAYSIFFSLKATEPASVIGSLLLEVREDVWPLRKKPYVHTCVNLTNIKTPEGEAP